jgi:hypothetical protein
MIMMATCTWTYVPQPSGDRVCLSIVVHASAALAVPIGLSVIGEPHWCFALLVF